MIYFCFKKEIMRYKYIKYFIKIFLIKRNNLKDLGSFQQKIAISHCNLIFQLLIKS